MDGGKAVEEDIGNRMHELARELFPIARSLTGEGVRETLGILQRELPGLTIKEVPSGTACFDWTVPPEWNVKDAYILGPDGRKLADFRQNNLHLVGYSAPIRQTIGLEALQAHLHSLPEQPDAIPYVTSYYQKNWGFCLSQKQRDALEEGEYEVVIDSTLDDDGSLTYGELVIPSTMGADREIFVSTYVCHPSMANNELSGPVVSTALARWLQSLDERRYTYRFIFIPETIGSILYLSLHLEHLKAHVTAGFNISCVGDERVYSYLPTRRGTTLSDRIARHALGHLAPDYVRHSFLERGSDERQYNAPGVDLPVVSVMRSKYGTYPEYHTSMDNLEFITPAGLYGSYNVLRHCFKGLECNSIYKAAVLCEPQLGKRGLYPSARKKGDPKPREMLDLLAYADGKTDLLEIADTTGHPIWVLAEAAGKLRAADLLEEISGP